MSSKYELVCSFLFKEKPMSKGVFSFKDAKFYLIAILYLSSFVIFSHDNFFKNSDGLFQFEQSIIAIVLAVVIFASLNFEMNLFGASKGANLFLQIMQIFPFTMFILRLIGRPVIEDEPESTFGEAVQVAKDFVNEQFGDLINAIPVFIRDISSNLGLLFLAGFVIVVLSIKDIRWRVGGLCFILIIYVAKLITSGEGSLTNFFIGSIVLGIGLGLQFFRYSKIVYFENITRRLFATKSVDQQESATILAIMNNLHTNGDMTEQTMLSIVKDKYEAVSQFTDNDLYIISREILRKMMHSYNLVTMSVDQNGTKLVARKHLNEDGNILRFIARFPRVFFFIILSAIVVLSPIDFIPDSIPFMGMLDDIIFSICSFWVCKNSLNND